MTATPIPRTLALAAYSDLDFTVLRELPRGRRPIRTFVCSTAGRARAGLRADSRGAPRRPAGVRGLPAGRGVRGACRRARRRPSSSGCASGELEGLRGGAAAWADASSAAKQQAMAAFASGAAHVLVATSVIEVGIDVPNATVMLVEDADRYGISQLHQLRGRIGRGDARRRCACCSGQRVCSACGRWPPIATASGSPRSTSSCAARASWWARASTARRRFSVAELPRDAELLERAAAAAARDHRRGSGARAARARAAIRRAGRDVRGRGAGADPRVDDEGCRRRVRRADARRAARSRDPADAGARARGAVLDPRRTSGARACSTCSRVGRARDRGALARGRRGDAGRLLGGGAARRSAATSTRSARAPRCGASGRCRFSASAQIARASIRSRVARSPISASPRARPRALGGAGAGPRAGCPRGHRERQACAPGAGPRPARRAPIRRHPDQDLPCLLPITA